MNIQAAVTEIVLAHKRARTLAILARETKIDRSWFDKVLKHGLDMRISTAQTLLDHQIKNGLPAEKKPTKNRRKGTGEDK